VAVLFLIIVVVVEALVVLAVVVAIVVVVAVVVTTVAVALVLALVVFSGQSFWLQIQRSRVRSPALPDFLSSSGSGTGSTQPRDVN